MVVTIKIFNLKKQRELQQQFVGGSTKRDML